MHCGAIICVALHIGGAGCIGAQTVNNDPSNFECPVCISTPQMMTRVLPYYLAGSGLRRTPKLAWPLFLLTLQLKNLDLLLRMVTFKMESNYKLENENV
jgi:hypothetical protein